ncbi:hypothetical protein QJQ45_030011 [Haematococcus lacustris]|nr:hypothetical protein QJQ45_030011 [Haematococcus lacustris]
MWLLAFIYFNKRVLERRPKPQPEAEWQQFAHPAVHVLCFPVSAGASGSGQQDQEQGQAVKEEIGERRHVIKAALPYQGCPGAAHHCQCAGAPDAWPPPPWHQAAARQCMPAGLVSRTCHLTSLGPQTGYPQQARSTSGWCAQPGASGMLSMCGVVPSGAAQPSSPSPSPGPPAQDPPPSPSPGHTSPCPCPGPPLPPAQAPPAQPPALAPPAQAQPLPAAPGPAPRPRAPPGGRWLDRDSNGRLILQRMGESMQRPLELCSSKDLEALPPVGDEYQQGYKRVNDRLPKDRQRLRRAAVVHGKPKLLEKATARRIAHRVMAKKKHKKDPGKKPKVTRCVITRGSCWFHCSVSFRPRQATTGPTGWLEHDPTSGDGHALCVPALFVSTPRCVLACQNGNLAWLQVIKVPEGAVLRGCKKTRRKLREHLRLRAEIHSQLRVIASLFVLRIFLTCLVGYPSPGYLSARQPPAVQPPQPPDAPPLPPLPPRAPAQPEPAQPASMECDTDSDCESDCDSDPEPQSDSESESEPEPVTPRRPPQAPRSGQAATQPAALEPGPSTPQPAKRSKRTKAEPGAAEPTKGRGKGKAAKAKPAPQPGRWLDRDCNPALNMQRIGESKWRPLELCYWPDQGALPAKGKEYPGLGYKRLRDKPPKAQEQQQPAEAQIITGTACNVGEEGAGRLAACSSSLALDQCQGVHSVSAGPWDLYTFPDFPYPEHLRPATTYPTGLEVQAYIRAYAEHFSLHQYIKLNCRLLQPLSACASQCQPGDSQRAVAPARTPGCARLLLQLRPGPHGQGWRVLYLDCVADRFYSVAADFVVMATGIYNQPLIPRIENEAEFKGQCTHAKHFTDPSLADNKDVVVVGAGKTAVDVQTMLAASKRARSVTALLRQGHWPVPRQVMHKAIKPVKRLFWRWFEGYIQADFNLSAERLPMERLPRDLFSGSQILDNKAAKWIMPGAVPTVRGSIQSFTANGILLQDGSFLRADLVLFCTGYTKSYEYLPGTLRAKLDLQKDGLYLYRKYADPLVAWLPPRLPSPLDCLAAEVSTYNNILTSGLQSLWLTALLQGRVQLPPVQVMQADVKEQQRWKRKVMPAQQHRGCVLMLYMQCYHDQLVTDLGLSPYRKGWALGPRERLAPYTSADYSPLFNIAQPTATAPDASVSIELQEPETGYAEAPKESRASLGLVPGLLKGFNLKGLLNGR